MNKHNLMKNVGKSNYGLHKCIAVSLLADFSKRTGLYAYGIYKLTQADLTEREFNYIAESTHQRLVMPDRWGEREFDLLIEAVRRAGLQGVPLTLTQLKHNYMKLNKRGYYELEGRN